MLLTSQLGDMFSRLLIEILKSLQMVKRVEEKTVNETLHCEKNFACLKNDKHVCCKVENCINNEVHFIDCAVNFNCSYKMSFGHSYFCTCPVRKEIHKKYGV